MRHQTGRVVTVCVDATVSQAMHGLAGVVNACVVLAAVLPLRGNAIYVKAEIHKADLQDHT